MLNEKKSMRSAVRGSALLCALLLAPVVRSDPLPNSPHITVVGNGSVSAKADMAVIQLSASVGAKSAESAQQQLDERVNEYLSFLTKTIGLEKKDIQTSDLQIYKSGPQQGKKDVATLHKAVRGITVTVPKLEDIDRVIKGATKYKVEKVSMVELKISNETPHRLAARDMAIKDAQEKVNLLAKRFNCKVGAIYSIYYNYESLVQPRLLSASRGQADLTDYYRQQSITFSDKVKVVFELHR